MPKRYRFLPGTRSKNDNKVLVGDETNIGSPRGLLCLQQNLARRLLCVDPDLCKVSVAWFTSQSNLDGVSSDNVLQGLGGKLATLPIPKWVIGWELEQLEEATQIADYKTSDSDDESTE